MNVLHLVLPDGVDDPSRPSGGNVYDRRLSDHLVARGWHVVEVVAPGRWPVTDSVATGRLVSSLAGMPDGATVLVDGLIASAVPEALESSRDRLSLWVLVHMPLGQDPADAIAYQRERRALSAARGVVTTSQWTRRWLLDSYGIAGLRVSVAEPGVDLADLATPDPTGRRLLCVGAVSRPKGHDLLLEALAEMGDLEWELVCVGSLDVEPEFSLELRHHAVAAGIADRVRFSGPLDRLALAQAYADSDLLVLASRSETYAMVVTEALAHGLPVLATEVGGVPEALAGAGTLVPMEDPHAFGAALRSWLMNPVVRQRSRALALTRRATLPAWPATASRVEAALLREAS